MIRFVSCLTFVGAVLVDSSLVFAQQTPDPTYGPHMWGAWHGWFFGPVMMIMFIAVAVVIVTLLVRRFGGFGLGGPGPQSQTMSPLDILKERFARGEIDKEEFEERRRVLGE